MLLSEAGHSWLDPSCYTSILHLRTAVTATTFPTRRRQNKQTVPVHVLALLLQLCVSPLLSSPLLFHLLWGFGALIHPWRPRGTQPPTHQSTRPATITDQRRDVTMRLRIAFRYDNRSAVTDAPPVHALLQQLQPCRCAEAPCKHPAGEEGCSPRARV